MQTVFKNFISGVILLMERSVQIGDIVEVDGTSGTVTAVDLRSSTVLGADGVETIVPNSVLLENKVTNWTHSDRRVRRVVKVGVAYGSPARDVADLLQDCAKRHGLVLADPKPMVLFEDFGADALQFGLYVWLELTPKVSATEVLSDLRFMIEKRLREAGIVMAFPQRDVHLDSSRPLRIEVVRGDAEGKPD
jgi:small-conductance mechanosensitive channel